MKKRYKTREKTFLHGHNVFWKMYFSRVSIRIKIYYNEYKIYIHFFLWFINILKRTIYLLSVTSVPVNFLHRLSALSSRSGSSLRNLYRYTIEKTKYFVITFWLYTFYISQLLFLGNGSVHFLRQHGSDRLL